MIYLGASKKIGVAVLDFLHFKKYGFRLVDIFIGVIGYLKERDPFRLKLKV